MRMVSRGQLPTLLLFLAVLSGTEVYGANAKRVKNKHVNITASIFVKTMEHLPTLVLNFTCDFDSKISPVYSIGLRRWIGSEYQEIIEARPDVDNGEVKKLPTYIRRAAKVWEARGSVKQRWLNLVLIEANDADAGDYTCYLVYYAGSQTLQSHWSTVYLGIDIEYTKAIMKGVRGSENWWNQHGPTFVTNAAIAFYTFAGVGLVGFAIVMYRRRRSNGEAARPAQETTTAATTAAATVEPEAAVPVELQTTGGAASV